VPFPNWAKPGGMKPGYYTRGEETMYLPHVSGPPLLSKRNTNVSVSPKVSHLYQRVLRRLSLSPSSPFSQHIFQKLQSFLGGFVAVCQAELTACVCFHSWFQEGLWDQGVVLLFAPSSPQKAKVLHSFLFVLCPDKKTRCGSPHHSFEDPIIYIAV